jgi:transcription elongation factor
MGADAELRPGDAVEWVRTSQRGRTTTMQLKSGTVEAIENGVATVRYGKRGRVHLHAHALRRPGQPNAIGQTIAALRAAAQEDAW